MKTRATSTQPHTLLIGILMALLAGHTPCLAQLIDDAPLARFAENAPSSPLPYDIRAEGLNGTTYYVSPLGSDNNPGTLGRPLRTLQAAADRAQPGDTVLARAGTYSAQDSYATLIITTTGTPEQWIRYANYPGERPLIRFNSLRGIAIRGASHIVIEGFELDGRSREVDPEEALAHATGFKGDDHSQTHFFSVGIRVENTEQNLPHHVIIRDNFIHHCSGGGIATARADYLLIENNHVYKTSLYTPWAGSGISVWESHNHDDRQDVYRTVVKDNISHHNNNLVPFWIQKKVTDGNGIIMDALKTAQGIIEDDYTKPYSGRILIANNVCMFNGGRGINLYESDRVDVVHNTLYHNGQRENSTNEIELGRADNVSVYNNIIVPIPGERAIGGYQSTGLRAGHNLVDGAGKSDFTYGQNTRDEDPRFVTLPDEVAEPLAVRLLLRHTLVPRHGSPAIGAASLDWRLHTDRVGTWRNPDRPVDIGAYQSITTDATPDNVETNEE
ncbi:right-handed parallel beta-helix repeat-containing protein [Mucisphaera calidilacus]|uniref:Right handed beta helix domain-containing protein n=1 Tax=Mucisphaera calidilacus TaxID=2527982 RepID=A0A518BU60_9BACT|nr:right-handed parallel beta-helix repeat-containing protein [Mucisphaera calidilacus]QDU70518.1 hypothetical protein Pan265_03460 [Mucisphaera calidilacus]